MATSANAAVPQVVGKVFVLYGTVKAVAPDGTVRILAPNSPIYANEQIITGSDGSVSIQFTGPPVTQLDLGRMTEIVIDEDVYAGVAPEVVADAAADAEKIQEALLEGKDPIDIEATAAGGDAGAGGGHSVVIFDLDGNEVTPGSGADTSGITTTGVNPIGGVFVTATAPEAPPYPGVVNLTATEQITEADGQLITYTAMVDNAPIGSNLVLTLSNGASITILVGETTGSTTVTASEGEDVYIDPENLPVSITGATGGGYTSLDASDTATTEVIDTDTPVTVVLSATESTGEDGGIITYTASLEDGKGDAVTTANDITVTLTNGEVITIYANSSSGSVDVDVNRDDVYLEDDSISNSIYNVVEANADTLGAFEKLGFDPEATVSTSITDDEDTTTAKLVVVSTDADENGYNIEYQVKLVDGQGNPVDVEAGKSVTVDVVVTDPNTQAPTTHTFTIAGGTSSSAAWTYSNANADPYIETESVSAAIDGTSVGINEGNFEKLIADTTPAVTPITDVEDTTTVTLDATVPVPGDTLGTYTTNIKASVNNAPETDLNLTIVDQNGDTVGTIKIVAGATEGSLVDVPVQLGVNYTYSILDPGYGAGNYEDLDFDDTAETYGPPNILNMSIVANTNAAVQYVLVEFSQNGNSFNTYIALNEQGQQHVDKTYAFDVGFDIDLSKPYDFSMKYVGNNEGVGGKGMINITDLSVENTSIELAGNIKLGDGSSHDGFDVTIDPILHTPVYNLDQDSDYFDRDDIAGGDKNDNILSGTDASNDAIDGKSGHDTLDGKDGYDLLMGDDGNDNIYGGVGKDGLTGGAGNDNLYGGSGNDFLHGGIGSDLLDGGAGNDTLIGDAGADTFKWNAGDQGTTTHPSVDTVKDFTLAQVGEKLDLSGLLQGEDKATDGNLEKFLHFEKIGNNTVINISSSGEFDGSNYATATDQQIVLENVDLGATGSNDQDILDSLLDGGHLITD